MNQVSQTSAACRRPGGNPAGRREWVYRAATMAGRILLAPLFQLCTSGAEHLPRASAFILLPKHQRWEDIVLLSLATPRPLYYVAKHELFQNPLSDRCLRSLGGIPLNRRRPLESRRSLKAVLECLQRREGVVIFPEGTYFPGRVGPGQLGMVRLVLTRLSLPFIPVGIRYDRDRWRTRVEVRFGQPLPAEACPTPEAFLGLAMEHIARLARLPLQCS